MVNRYFLSLLLLLAACAPYANGPVFTTQNADKTFQPILDFMDAKPGMVVADVGAGSGALTVIMATQLDSCTVYIQDIDRKILDQENVNKMVDYYSKQLGYDLGKRNTFHITYGDATHTNLPDGAFDLIYSNATVHVLDQPVPMLTDLKKKLKPNGRIFIRDSFKGDHGEGEYCSDKKCAKRLLTIDEFLAMMDQNGFRLEKQSTNMSGYPIYGFSSKQ